MPMEVQVTNTIGNEWQRERYEATPRVVSRARIHVFHALLSIQRCYCYGISKLRLSVYQAVAQIQQAMCELAKSSIGHVRPSLCLVHPYSAERARGKAGVRLRNADLVTYRLTTATQTDNHRSAWTQRRITRDPIHRTMFETCCHLPM